MDGKIMKDRERVITTHNRIERPKKCKKIKRKKTVTQLIHSILLYIFCSLHQPCGRQCERDEREMDRERREWLKLFVSMWKNVTVMCAVFFVRFLYGFFFVIDIVVVVHFEHNVCLRQESKKKQQLFSRSALVVCSLAFIIYSTFMHPFRMIQCETMYKMTQHIHHCTLNECETTAHKECFA